MRPTKTYDQERISFNLAKLRKEGEEYEIVVDPDLAVSYKEGDEVDVLDVLKSEEVFFDAKKGERASEERMNKVFGTIDAVKIAEIILKDGEIQLTAEHRARVREDKRKRIVQLICQNACDPKTKLPHPPTRIENAMEEAKVKIDEFKRAQDQVNDIIKALRPIMPISVEERTVKVHLTAEYAAKAYGMMQGFGTMKEENWLNDGSWMGLIVLPAGMVNDFFDKLNAATHGGVETSIVE